VAGKGSDTHREDAGKVVGGDIGGKACEDEITSWEGSALLNLEK
jgi:hypothetical protein